MHRDPALTELLPADADAQALRSEGLAAYVDGRLQDARSLLEASVRAAPLDHEAASDLAAVCLEIGDCAEAFRLVRRALALEPEHDPSRLTEALALAGLGQREAAMTRLWRLLRGAAPLGERQPELAALAWSHLARLRGDPEPSIRIVDPRSMSFRHRLDLLAKYLYARKRLGLLSDWVRIDVDELYAKHIHVRTGGIEPGDGVRKSCLADYFREFDALIDRMADGGFDAGYPVPMSAEDGLPRNGAHRIAAALAVGCDIVVSDEAGPGGPHWGDDWFATHGFDTRERDTLLHAWAEVKADRACVVVLWSAVEQAWDAIEAAIDARLPVVARRTVDLPAAAFAELVHDIYSHDCGPASADNIARKAEFLGAYAPRVRVLFVERPDDVTLEQLGEFKAEIRQGWKHLVDVDRFATIHITSSAGETRHLLSIFANENNLRWLRHRSSRPELVSMLSRMVEVVRARDIDPRDCCVVGASVLDALGIRAATDVDFTVRSGIRAARFDDGVTQLAPVVDLVSKDYPRSFSAAPAPTDDDLIADASLHFFVRGIRFADPRVVLTRKQHQRRDKDLLDVALLGEFLRNRAA